MSDMERLQGIVNEIKPLAERLRRQRRAYMDAPKSCDFCGFTTKEVPTRISLKGIRHLQPGDCTEDEYVEYCPECGATECFQTEREG